MAEQELRGINLPMNLNTQLKQETKKCNTLYGESGSLKNSLFKNKKLHKLIAKFWERDLYHRNYVDRSSMLKDEIKIPGEGQINQIFKDMLKTRRKIFLIVDIAVIMAANKWQRLFLIT